jgi:hypothetical protein
MPNQCPRFFYLNRTSNSSSSSIRKLPTYFILRCKCKIYSSLNIRHTVSHPHKMNGKVIYSCTALQQQKKQLMCVSSFGVSGWHSFISDFTYCVQIKAMNPLLVSKACPFAFFLSGYFRPAFACEVSNHMFSHLSQRVQSYISHFVIYRSRPFFYLYDRILQSSVLNVSTSIETNIWVAQ